MSGTEDPNGPGPAPGEGELQAPPPVTEPTPEPPPQEPPPPAAAEPPPQVDWRDRRIGEQQQRLRERNARIAQLEAENAQLKGTVGTAQPGYQPGAPSVQPQPQPTFPQPTYQGDIQRQIDEAATQLAAAKDFNRRCDEVAEAGRKIYPNFDQRVQRLAGLIDPNDMQQRMKYNEFLNAALETGQAQRLIYDLGGDLNEASRIMSMDQTKMAVELTRLSSRASTTDATSTPRPITPAASIAQNNRTVMAPDDPNLADGLSTEEWMRRREEQVATRRQLRR